MSLQAASCTSGTVPAAIMTVATMLVSERGYRLVKQIGIRLARAVNSRLGLLEAGPHPEPILPPPVLIVGPPRSGTTLLFQLMVQQLDVAYLSNAHHALFGAPSLLERLVPRRMRVPPAGQDSSFGHVKGIWAPSEAGNFWYRFFPMKPHHVSPEEFPDRARARLRSAVAAFTRASGRPMVSKNVMCSVRIEAISSAIPEMRYIIVTRDIVDVATSLLAARLAVHGSIDRWLSVEPQDIDRIAVLPPEHQVVEQVLSVQAAMQVARSSLPADRFVDVGYRALASNPAAELSRLANSLEVGFRRQHPDLPRSLHRRAASQVDPATVARVQSYVDGR